MNGNRERNFNANEKSLLITLVGNHKDVLECKVTNKISSQKKEEEWKLLAREWNNQAIHHCHENFNPRTSIGMRQATKLIKCWENMKRTAKGEKAAEKTAVFQTGGGTNNVVVTEDSVRVYSIIQDQIDPLPNPYDDDEVVIPSSSTSSSSASTFASSSSGPEAGTGNPSSHTAFPPPKTFKRKLPEIHHGAKRSAQYIILDKAEAEYEKKMSILEKENILVDKKIELANLKITLMEKRLRSEM